MGLNQVGSGLVPFSSSSEMWRFPQHEEDIPRRYTDMRDPSTESARVEVAEETAIFSQITSRPHVDPEMGRSLSNVDKVPAMVWRPDQDDEENGFATFTIDNFNVAQALAKLVQFDARHAARASKDPMMQNIRSAAVHWLEFPTTFERILKEFRFIGYLDSGKKEDDAGAALKARGGLHLNRVQWYGEVNNTPCYWAGDNVTIGSTVGFMLKEVPFGKLNFKQISPETIGRSPQLAATRVFQLVPWSSKRSKPPSFVDNDVHADLAADCVVHETVYASDDPRDPGFGTPVVSGNVWRPGMVLTVGTVMRVNKAPSHQSVQDALVSFDGVKALKAQDAIIDLALSPSPALGF